MLSWVILGLRLECTRGTAYRRYRLFQQLPAKTGGNGSRPDPTLHGFLLATADTAPGLLSSAWCTRRKPASPTVPVLRLSSIPADTAPSRRTWKTFHGQSRNLSAHSIPKIHEYTDIVNPLHRWSYRAAFQQWTHPNTYLPWHTSPWKLCFQISLAAGLEVFP